MEYNNIFMYATYDISTDAFLEVNIPILLLYPKFHILLKKYNENRL